jgi:hypothetical protein
VSLIHLESMNCGFGARETGREAEPNSGESERRRGLT